MIWPPVKAWTSKLSIRGNIHFVAINYGGESLNKWVILMSVIDSNVVVKVSWSQLIDSSRWKSGWDEITDLESFKFPNFRTDLRTNNLSYPSSDSGLTIPITENKIRPWFEKV